MIGSSTGFTHSDSILISTIAYGYTKDSFINVLCILFISGTRFYFHYLIHVYPKMFQLQSSITHCHLCHKTANKDT